MKYFSFSVGVDGGTGTVRDRGKHSKQRDLLSSIGLERPGTLRQTSLDGRGTPTHM